jgi:hypothetical protein
MKMKFCPIIKWNILLYDCLSCDAWVGPTMTKCPRPYPGHKCRGIMGKKLGVERGPLEISLHLLGGRDEIINESTQNHQPPPPDKKWTVPYRIITICGQTLLQLSKLNKIFQKLNRTSYVNRKDHLLLLLKIFVQIWRSKASFPFCISNCVLLYNPWTSQQTGY